MMSRIGAGPSGERKLRRVTCSAALTRTSATDPIGRLSEKLPSEAVVAFDPPDVTRAPAMGAPPTVVNTRPVTLAIAPTAAVGLEAAGDESPQAGKKTTATATRTTSAVTRKTRTTGGLYGQWLSASSVELKSPRESADDGIDWRDHEGAAIGGAGFGAEEKTLASA